MKWLEIIGQLLKAVVDWMKESWADKKATHKETVDTEVSLHNELQEAIRAGDTVRIDMLNDKLSKLRAGH